MANQRRTNIKGKKETKNRRGNRDVLLLENVRGAMENERPRAPTGSASTLTGTMDGRRELVAMESPESAAFGNAEESTVADTVGAVKRANGLGRNARTTPVV